MSDLGLVEKTIVVLRTIAAKPAGIGLSSLARECGIPKATCHRIIMTLVTEGWLSVDPATKQFRVSLTLLFMLGDVAKRNESFGYTQEILAALALDTQETSGLDELSGSSVIVLTQAIGPFLVSHGQQAVPRMLPAWRTSSGKALLAWTDPGIVRRDFQNDPDLARTNLYPDFEAFVDELAATRERGYSFAIDELEAGAAAVSAPVHVGSSVPYAVWVGGPTYRLTREKIPEVAERLIAAAKDLSRVLENSPTLVQSGR
jgi:DNA-binding IclR family transcriptional regulator